MVTDLVVYTKELAVRVLGVVQKAHIADDHPSRLNPAAAAIRNNIYFLTFIFLETKPMNEWH
jgi:hypothetical protein